LSNVVLTDIVLVCHRDASIFFYSISTYSYMSSYFVSHLSMSRDSLDIPFFMSTPVKDFIVVDRVYWSSVVTINGFDRTIDLLLLDMVDFKVILGMN